MYERRGGGGERGEGRGEKKASERGRWEAIVCVLHTGSLTRIYIGVHRHARTGRHYYKTCARVNPFVLRFRRRRRRRPSSIGITSRRFLLRSRGENFAFSSLPSHSPLTPRDLPPPEVFGFLNANGTRAHRDRIRITLPIELLIGRSKEEDRVLRVLSFYCSPEYPQSVCKKAKEERRDRSTSSSTSYASFAE